jgi:hypothetical protein
LAFTTRTTAFFSASVIVTLAPATVAPFESRTVPRRLPVTSWAFAVKVRSANNASAATRIRYLNIKGFINAPSQFSKSVSLLFDGIACD